jgi:hypothetical protein
MRALLLLPGRRRSNVTDRLTSSDVSTTTGNHGVFSYLSVSTTGTMCLGVRSRQLLRVVEPFKCGVIGTFGVDRPICQAATPRVLTVGLRSRASTESVPLMRYARALSGSTLDEQVRYLVLSPCPGRGGRACPWSFFAHRIFVTMSSPFAMDISLYEGGVRRARFSLGMSRSDPEQVRAGQGRCSRCAVLTGREPAVRGLVSGRAGGGVRSAWFPLGVSQRSEVGVGTSGRRCSQCVVLTGREPAVRGWCRDEREEVFAVRGSHWA